MVIKNVTKRQLDNIKIANEEDYATILIASQLYTENEKLLEPSEIIRKGMIAVITDILDKYNIRYINDLEMNG